LGGRDQQSGAAVVDIFDEVQQDLQAERTARLLRRYGWLLGAVALAVVAGAGAWQGWHWYETRQASRDATAYLLASRTAQPAGGVQATAEAKQSALATFEQLAAHGTPGYRALGALRAAALLAEAGDLAGASARWDQVAADGAGDPLLRGLANLLWAQHHLDAGDPEAVAARLQPLLASDSPWRGLAQEAQAVLDLRQGHDAPAHATLEALSKDSGAPDGVRSRAANLLARLGE
jgi:hypothetical protein